MTEEKLLSERHRFKEDYMPYQLSSLQQNARRLFLDYVHKKNQYISIKKCPYCGDDSFTKISEVERRGLPSEIVICNSCDGCFKAKILNSQMNAYHYEKISYSLRGKEISEDIIKKLFENRVKSFAYPRYHFITHFIDLIPGRDTVVELGCNDGANLLPWFKNNFKVAGYDLDPRMVTFGRKKGLNLIHGDLIEFQSSRLKAKLIILSHVLEHVSDVNTMLQGLVETLQSDGYVFIEVPGLIFQGVRNSLSYFDVEHNYYFDMNSLTLLLKKHGFKIIYADQYIRIICTPEQNVSIPAGKGSPVSFRGMKAGLMKLLIEIMNFKSGKNYDLLKKGESNNVRTSVLKKLQSLYFVYFYSSIVKHMEKNEGRK
ncbi:MAG: class I SAM-dependent methyltransferase [Candidatus Brocadiaceae bacterium]|nr:class I SAM-dependent methyltransferase [Candidatus Brocadiaceae bacterium]